jgi:hypothetical protein
MDSRDRVIELECTTIDEIVSGSKRGETLVLTRDGEPLAAVISIDRLRTLTDERELLRRLALGELESAGGEGDDLETVLADCRLLLEEN